MHDAITWYKYTTIFWRAKCATVLMLLCLYVLLEIDLVWLCFVFRIERLSGLAVLCVSNGKAIWFGCASCSELKAYRMLRVHLLAGHLAAGSWGYCILYRN